MKKKPALNQFTKSMPEPAIDAENEWHNGAEMEIYSYTRCLRKAAATLLERRSETRTDWDVCPIILLYKQALELHMKALVGDGGNFLKAKTDSITLSQTHSLRWLAQLVCQVIKAVQWEREFVCEGVTNLAEFSALVGEVESLDPVVKARLTVRFQPPDFVANLYRTFNIIEFASKLDALLDLLDITADALAAAWDLQQDQSPFPDPPSFEPTIH